MTQELKWKDMKRIWTRIVVVWVRFECKSQRGESLGNDSGSTAKVVIQVESVKGEK